MKNDNYSELFENRRWSKILYRKPNIFMGGSIRMSNKFKKSCSILLCVLTAVAFTSCSSNTKISGSGSSEAEVSGNADPLGKYTPEITLKGVRSMAGTYDSSNPDRKSISDNIWISTYKSQLGINVEYLWTPNQDQYDTKWSTALASGDIPDFGQVDTKIYKMLVKANLVEDMTNILPEYANDYYKQAYTGDNGLTNSYLTKNSKLYGLPVTGSQPDNLPMLYIRKDWLEKAGLTEPKTIDDVIEIAKTFKQKQLGGKDTIGIALNNTFGATADQCDAVGLLNGMGAYTGVWVKDGSGKLVYSTTLPEYRAALQKLQTWYKEGIFEQDFSVRDATKAGQLVGAGQCGIFYGSFWPGVSAVGDNFKNDKNSNWEVIPIPTLDGSTPKVQAKSSPSSFVFVKKGCKHPEAVVKMINLYFKLMLEQPTVYSNTSDGAQIFQYAPINTISFPWYNLNTYKQVTEAIKTGDKSKMTMDRPMVYDYVQKGISGQRDMMGYNLVFGPNSTYSVVDKYKTNNQIIIDAYQSLPTDTMDSKDSTLTTSLNATIMKVIMGDSIDTFDKAISDWKNMGGTDITKEVNDWYSVNK